MPPRPRKRIASSKPARYKRPFIREWREYRGMTLEQVSFKCGYNEGYLSELENGKRRYNQEILEALAPVLRTTPDRLISRPPSRHPEDPEDAWAAMSDADRVRAITIFKAAVDAAES